MDKHKGVGASPHNPEVNSELNFYRGLEVEVGGLQPRKVKAQSLWDDLNNQLAQWQATHPTPHKSKEGIDHE